VSTRKQGASGLGLEAQRAAVEGYLSCGSWKNVAEFTEIESGRHSDRPALEEAHQLEERIHSRQHVPRRGRLRSTARDVEPDSR